MHLFTSCSSTSIYYCHPFMFGQEFAMNCGPAILCLLIMASLENSLALENSNNIESDAHVIFDFTSLDSTIDWTEQSDTVRTVGMSKAELVLQKTQVFQRAIFFALLNPQPNGAGFAGVRKVNFHANLEKYNDLEIRCRGQGIHDGFKIVLRHRGLNDEPNYTYEQMFSAPRDFQTVKLPLNEFKPFYRGREINTTETLDKSDITGFGIQYYGGVYLPIKQSGPVTLEIDWVRAI